MQIRMRVLLSAAVLLLVTAGPAAAEELDLDKVNQLFEEGKKLNNKCVDTRLSLNERNKLRVAALEILNEAYATLEKWCEKHPEDMEKLDDLMCEIGQMRYWIKKELPANLLPDDPENRAAPQPDWPDEPPEDLHKPALPPGTPEDPNAKPIPPGPSIVEKNLEAAKEYEKDHPWDHPGIRDLYLDIVAHALPGTAEYSFAIKKVSHYNGMLKDAYRLLRNEDPDTLKLAGSEERKLVHSLAKDLKSREADVRLRAAEYLGLLGSGDGARHLVKALKREKEETVVDMMFGALSKIGGSKTTKELGSIRKWKKEEMERRAIEILGEMIDRSDVEGRYASITLGLFVYSTNKKIARDALDQLKALGPKGTLGLINAVTVQDFQLKKDVIRALGDTGDGRAGAGLGPLLMGGVKGKLAEIRNAAFDACKKIGKPVVPYLAPYVEGNRPFHARRVIYEITGRSFKSKGAVLQWWEKNK
ncbi:MAG: hypothetical protein ABFS86_02870 [Planctomycetota bacterium]